MNFWALTGVLSGFDVPSIQNPSLLNSKLASPMVRALEDTLLHTELQFCTWESISRPFLPWEQNTRLAKNILYTDKNGKERAKGF